MKAKKTNAVLSLITIILFLAHLLYHVITYMVGYYNPVLTKISGYVLVFVIVLHAVMSMVIVCRYHDSKTIRYKKKNWRTLFQRITAGLMVLLLPLHIFEFSLIAKNYGNFLYYVIEALKFVFYAAVMYHVALSFTGALVTLGILQDSRKKKIIDRILFVAASIIFLALGIYFTVMHTVMLSK